MSGNGYGTLPAIGLTMFVIEDECHAEWIGKFASRDEAHGMLRKLAELS